MSRGEVAGLIPVVVLGHAEVEARLELPAREARDTRQVVGQRRRVVGAAGERAHLSDTSAAVLEEAEAGGLRRVRRERERGEGQRNEREAGRAVAAHDRGG